MYQIGSASDWLDFSFIVLDEPNANAVLTADVELGADAPMLASEDNRYGGTFDGQGHTLTVNYTNNDTEGTAPFLNVSGATFRNITVAGTITTGKKCAAGFVYQSYGATFENCVSSVAINSSVNGDGTHGGFVAIAQSGTTAFTNCVFDGKLLGSSTDCCAGFVGWRNGTVNLTSCLYAPAEVTIGTNGCHTFCRNNPSSNNNCYYTQALNTTVGTFVAQILAGEGVTISGTPTVSHKNVGYFSSPATLTLNYILPCAITDEAITTSVQRVVPAGSQPTPVLTYGDYTLVSGTDYELTIGDGNYIITGKGNYTGTIEGTYTELGEVAYLDYNAEDNTFVSATCSEYNVLDNQTELSAGWWVVAANTTIDSRLTCTGDVKLILMDGVTLTAPKGITVNYDSSANNLLTVYAQSEGDNMGKLVVNNVEDDNAGIGGTDDNAHGVITINGGDLTVTGGSSGAGIGTGFCDDANATNSYVYVHGGKVNTTGGHIIITGGEVTARGDIDIGGPGIGGSDGSSADEIIISGGIVNAIGGEKSPGIGGGGYWGSSHPGGQSGTITISGGQVTATAGTDCPTAIGAGANPATAGESDVITLSWTDPYNDFITANGNYVSGSIALGKMFALDGTTTLATLDNIAGITIVPAATVTIAEGIEHGTIVADKELVALGGDRTVTLTVTPDEGYELNEITIETVDIVEPSGAPERAPKRAQIDVTQSDNDSYTFDMPDQPVLVTATFKEKAIITAIDNINVDKRSGQRYNLMGQPVGKDYKCVVIEDGQKRVIK